MLCKLVAMQTLQTLDTSTWNRTVSDLLNTQLKELEHDHECEGRGSDRGSVRRKRKQLCLHVAEEGEDGNKSMFQVNLEESGDVMKTSVYMNMEEKRVERAERVKPNELNVHTRLPMTMTTTTATTVANNALVWRKRVLWAVCICVGLWLVQCILISTARMRK